MKNSSGHSPFPGAWDLFLLGQLFCLAAAALASAPSDIVIQGKLTGSGGAPLSGTRAYLVKFYNAVSGGTQLGSTISGTVALGAAGRFSLTVCPPAQVLAATGDVYYELSIDSAATPDGAVGSSDVFSTRAKVNSVLWAQRAGHSIRSERELCHQIRYNLLYRWFLDLSLQDTVWDHSTFSKNRERFATHGLMARFFQGSVVAAINAEAASIEHFSVDGSLLKAWASMKSFRPKDEPPPPQGGDGGQARPTAGWTDPEARLARKGPGQSSAWAHSVHVLMDNRNGLIVGLDVRGADGRAEREAAVEPPSRPNTTGPHPDP